MILCQKCSVKIKWNSTIIPAHLSLAADIDRKYLRTFLEVVHDIHIRPYDELQRDRSNWHDHHRYSPKIKNKKTINIVRFFCYSI